MDFMRGFLAILELALQIYCKGSMEPPCRACGTDVNTPDENLILQHGNPSEAQNRSPTVS